MRRHLLIAAGQLAHHVRKRHAAALLTPGNIPGLVPGSPAAATPLTPGNIPSLVPGSPAAAAWWTAQIAHTGRLAHHVGKRQAATPLTPGNIPGLVPGSSAAHSLKYVCKQ